MQIQKVKDKWNDRQAKLKAAGLSAKESAQQENENFDGVKERRRYFYKCIRN